MSNIYAIDFDGTIVSNHFPYVGDFNQQMIGFIYALKASGHRWILYTMREEQYLKDALEALAKINIVPDAVNDNLESEQKEFGNNSRKVYADY